MGQTHHLLLQRRPLDNSEDRALSSKITNTFINASVDEEKNGSRHEIDSRVERWDHERKPRQDQMGREEKYSYWIYESRDGATT